MATTIGTLKCLDLSFLANYSFANFRINSVALNPFMIGMSQSIKMISIGDS
jgi:hypothetical protein